jgi:hypothetical protein
MKIKRWATWKEKVVDWFRNYFQFSRTVWWIPRITLARIMCIATDIWNLNFLNRLKSWCSYTERKNWHTMYIYLLWYTSCISFDTDTAMKSTFSFQSLQWISNFDIHQLFSRYPQERNFQIACDWGRHNIPQAMKVYNMYMYIVLVLYHLHHQIACRHLSIVQQALYIHLYVRAVGKVPILACGVLWCFHHTQIKYLNRKLIITLANNIARMKEERNLKFCWW